MKNLTTKQIDLLLTTIENQIARNNKSLKTDISLEDWDEITDETETLETTYNLLVNKYNIEIK